MGVDAARSGRRRHAVTWPENLREQVLNEFVEAARYRGAIEPAESADDHAAELRRVQKEAEAKFREERRAREAPRKRRIVA